jgi:hypothetical protein
MRCHPLGRLIGLLLALASASGCNPPDVIGSKVKAHTVGDAASPDAASSDAAMDMPDSAADSATPPIGDGGLPGLPNCGPDALARYNRVLRAFFSIETSCELPLSVFSDGLPTPPSAINPPKGAKELVCQAQPWLTWAEPQPPLPVKKFVFCEEPCRFWQQVLRCRVLSDQCHDASEDPDGVTLASVCTPQFMP